MDSKRSMIVSHFMGFEHAGQKEDPVTETHSELQLTTEQDFSSSPGEDVVLKRSGGVGDEECKRRRMEQHMVDASGVCQEPKEVISSPAVISRAIKDLVDFQDQAEYISGDVLAPYLISGIIVD